MLSLTLLLGACDAEESLNIVTPEAEFVLDTPGISNVFLNFALPDNPAFTISWKDEITSSSSYSVEMSTDKEFTTPIFLGTTDKNNFSMNVVDFNQAITDAGVTTFRDIAIYLRVDAGNQVSNDVLLLVTTYPVNAPIISGVTNGDAFVLSIANNDVTAVTVGWDDPIANSSLNVPVTYYLEVAAPNTNFAMPIEAGSVSNMDAISLTNAQLNNFAIQSGIPVDTAGDLELRVRSVIIDAASGSTIERITTPITINVTTYLTVLDLSSTWGVIGSAANNWGATPDLPFFTTDVDGVLAAYVTLTDGEIKFRQNNSWDAPNKNYGDNGADGSLEEGGTNIAVTAGSYKIVMDVNNLTYTIEQFSLGIIGDAYNNWGATPDFMLEYDQYSDVFRGIVTLLDGQMKFRMNNSWDAPNKNYGDDGADGTLEEGAANISVTAGIYIVTVDLNGLEYTLEPIDNVWGVVGDAYNDWGATPDAQFTRDWSKPFNDVWVLNDVTLTDGSYKIRANNSWDAPNPNYGDDGADGILELGGANIAATAGTYDIILDFSDPANPTYTVN